MKCNVTLTADEFEAVDSALCELDMVKSRLEDVLNKDLYIKLAKATTDIRRSLKGAYQQLEKSVETKMDYFYRTRDELGLSATWSIYEIDNFSERHPYEGVTTVTYKDHWGEKTVVTPINGLTWAALYVAADAAIRDSGDDHHVFIEGFTQDGNTLVLTTGS